MRVGRRYILFIKEEEEPLVSPQWFAHYVVVVEGTVLRNCTDSDDENAEVDFRWLRAQCLWRMEFRALLSWSFWSLVGACNGWWCPGRLGSSERRRQACTSLRSTSIGQSNFLKMTEIFKSCRTSGFFSTIEKCIFGICSRYSVTTTVIVSNAKWTKWTSNGSACSHQK